ncbi:MAG: TonB-dependent receptor plug domain-containing protein, partial [Rugosibacter sp.]
MTRHTPTTRSLRNKNQLPKLLPLSAMILASLASSPAANAQEVASTVEKQLPAVTVQAEAEKADGYRATTTRVGKTLQDPHDIPQAITTITKTLMEEQQVGSLREALRNVSGLTFNAAEGGRSGDNMNLRGFYTFGDMYLDGIRDTAQYNRETFNYEQIDVLRGAGAMLFGRGQAGGVINQVSKTPLNEEQYKLTGSIGENDYQEVTADLNKPLNENTAVRINLLQRDEGSWRSNPATGSEPEIHRKGIGI